MTGVSPRNHGVLVSWDAPADNGGSAIVGYKVQVLTLDGQQVGANRLADGSASRFLVQGLNNGQGYRFRVRAVNAVGVSLWSSTMRAKPVKP
jgi:titin